VDDPRFLLDSNACIYLLEGLSDRLRDRVESHAPSDIVTSAIVYAEVVRGLDADDPVALTKTDRLFEKIAILPFDRATARAYMRVPFRPGSFDRLIAAHALAINLVLVTSNARDFADIPGLEVEDWTV
jgi:tRNA(fMet)-specific endonuclease VapC